jgi:hypothetical protein
LAEEYRTLSNSGSQADRHTYTALQWGTALVAVIASATLSQWGKHDGIVEASFLIVIPALISFGMLYWVGELARLRRVYDFICIVEAKAELALQIDPPHQAQGDWYTSFEKRWKDERKVLLHHLDLRMPKTRSKVVEVDAAPIEFERWLRRIRAARASSNLSWVFMFRFILFPIGIAGTWATGLYYLLSHMNTHVSRTLGIAAAVMGVLTSAVTTWLAAELASDLNDAKSERQISRARRWLRDQIHQLLALPEWSKPSQ